MEMGHCECNAASPKPCACLSNLLTTANTVLSSLCFASRRFNGAGDTVLSATKDTYTHIAATQYMVQSLTASAAATAAAQSGNNNNNNNTFNISSLNLTSFAGVRRPAPPFTQYAMVRRCLCDRALSHAHNRPGSCLRPCSSSTPAADWSGWPH